MAYLFSTVVLSCYSMLVLTDVLAGVSPPASRFRYSLPWAGVRYLGIICAVALAITVFA